MRAQQLLRLSSFCATLASAASVAAQQGPDPLPPQGPAAPPAPPGSAPPPGPAPAGSAACPGCEPDGAPPPPVASAPAAPQVAAAPAAVAAPIAPPAAAPQSPTLVPAPKPDLERDGVRLRGGLSLNGGLLFYPDTSNVGGGGGLALRLGVQFNHYFSLVYQNMPWLGGIGTGSGGNGYFFDFNSVLANLTLGHVFDIGVGPSFDLVYGFACSIVDTGPQCSTSQTVFAPAAHGRLAFYVGGLSGNGPRRSGLVISLDVHPFFPVNFTFPNNVVSLLASQAGVGFEWY